MIDKVSVSIFTQTHGRLICRLRNTFSPSRHHTQAHTCVIVQFAGARTFVDRNNRSRGGTFARVTLMRLYLLLANLHYVIHRVEIRRIHGAVTEAKVTPTFGEFSYAKVSECMLTALPLSSKCDSIVNNRTYRSNKDRKTRVSTTDNVRLYYMLKTTQ